MAMAACRRARHEPTILSLTLRVVFNLFSSIKDHLKVTSIVARARSSIKEKACVAQGEGAFQRTRFL